MNIAASASAPACMKILIVAPEFPPRVGGMATHAACLARLLAGRGHGVRVLTTKGEWQEDWRVPRLTVFRVLTGRYGADVRRIRAAAVGAETDVVLLLNAGFARVAMQLSVPVVARTVGNDVYAAWVGPRLPLRALFWRLPQGSIPAATWLRHVDQERRVAKVVEGLGTCGAVVCNSEYTRRRLRELGISDSILSVVIGGVDTGYFKPGVGWGERAGLDGTGEAVVGISGNLKPIKGVRIAIDAI